MTAVLLPQGKQSFITAAGIPLVGGKVFTYDTGTVVPRLTWSDAAQVSPNTNPIILDARGEAVIYWSGAYKVQLQDSLGNIIWTVDPVTSAQSQSAIGEALWPRTVAEIAAAVIPVFYNYPPYNARRYGILFDNATDNTSALNNAIKACCQAGEDLILDACGTALYGRLNAIPAALKIVGLGSKQSILKVIGGGSWPYTANTNPLWTSSFNFEAEGVGFDQSWTYAAHGTAGAGYNDGASPSTWNTNFLGNFTGGLVRIRRCGFFNISRGFWVNAATDVEFTHNIGDSALSDSQTIFATSGCQNVRKSNNYLVGPKWTDYVAVTHIFIGLAALYSFGDTNLQICDNVTIGYQMVQCGNAFASTRCVFADNIIDYPVADTSFQNWTWLSITGNAIHMSGDMGIAVDQSDYVAIVGNIIDSIMVGCINVGGSKSATVVGNVCRDWMQGYALVNTFAGRYCSTAGAWGAAITAGFQSSNDGGLYLCIQGNSCSMVNLPPVSDTFGPVRAITLGIYLQQTSSTPQVITGIVGGNYLQTDFATLPSGFIYLPTYYFFSSAHTGTMTPGETCTDGAGNSFQFLASFGDGGACFISKVKGTVFASRVFTGSTSGSTITVQNPAGFTWTRLRDIGNVDYWTVSDQAASLALPMSKATQNIPGTPYTFVLSDAGKLVTNNTGVNWTWTIPPNSAVPYDIGTVIWLATGGGQLNINRGAGVSLFLNGAGASANQILAAGGAKLGVAMLTQISLDQWILSMAF